VAATDTGPRGPASTHGPEADALLDEVRAATGTLAKLLAHSRDLGEPVTRAVRGVLEDVTGRLDRRELRVVVVGEERAGKSTFLDALLGERLLGLAKTPPNTITTIRSTTALGYRARLTDGLVDDFATRAPDRTAELTAAIENDEARLALAKRSSVAAAIEVAAAADALERVQTGMTDAFRAFEAARSEAEQCGAKLATTQQAWGRQCAESVERANMLPAIVRHKAPPWWAFWLWVVRLFATLWNLRNWQSHRALLAACGKTEAEVDALRAASSRAAERCAQAEAKLGTDNVPVEEARRALDAARRIQHDADASCESLDRKIVEGRREIERARKERKHRFFAEVRSMSNMEDRGQDVIELEIDYPAWLLPDDVVLIEAPGITSDEAGARERAWRAIRERADTCILVSELERAVSGETHRFLQPLREAVPHAVLVLTKMDETVRAATRKGEGDPAEQVERARRIGTRRFAREMGRDPATVLSVTVAAEETLRGAPSSDADRRRFEADVATLFTLLRYERALILGASSAGMVRRCIGGLAGAEQSAALAHRDRIASLEAKRIPDPEQFQAEQMASVDAVIVEEAKGIVASAARVVRENADLIRTECKSKITACTTKSALQKLAPELAVVVARGIGQARDAASSHCVAEADRRLMEIEKGVFQALRERYYILHQISHPPDLPVAASARIAVPGAPSDLAPKLDDLVRSFDRFRVGYGVGGAAVGAGVGTLILPGLGSLAGALIGGLATFAKTFGALKRDVEAAVDASVAGLERALLEQIEAAELSLVSGMRTVLGKSLEETLARFARFVEEPLQEQRVAIASEREQLRELELIQKRLRQHDAHLEALIKAATDASVGLCR